jgi:aryl-phospho-beta-D-glucosidase BglC (GH1 family)
MKKVFLLSFLFTIVFFNIQNIFSQNFEHKEDTFINIKDKNLFTPDGKKILLQGINLGNWLNPEGYMFLFDSSASSYRMIDQVFKEMVGPDFTNWFWAEFKKNYITKEDIFYIKQTGMNSIRLPFHYKLFTNEDYMGLNANQNGFEIFDQIIEWCREAGLYVILDMHDAPGGQTGDNIDDSYGYPWLMESPESQQLFVAIWKKIAQKYADEPIILGYDLLNEPIAHYFTEKDKSLNDKLVPLYKKAVKAIREVDNNHIILLGGAQWNSNFTIFDDWDFDNKLMFTCHRYWCGTKQENVQDFVDFRDKVNLPMYMGETGENTDEWCREFRILLENNNIGWHYWPYKKMVPKAGMLIIKKPENWDLIIDYSKADRSNFAKIREIRPNQELVKKAMLDLLENMKFKNCEINKGYTEALGMKP